MTINRKIEGTDIFYLEVLKWVTSKLNGYYMFESEVLDHRCSDIPG